MENIILYMETFLNGNFQHVIFIMLKFLCFYQRAFEMMSELNLHFKWRHKQTKTTQQSPAPPPSSMAVAVAVIVVSKQPASNHSYIITLMLKTKFRKIFIIKKN